MSLDLKLFNEWCHKYMQLCEKSISKTVADNYSAELAELNRINNNLKGLDVFDKCDKHDEIIALMKNLNNLHNSREIIDNISSYMSGTYVEQVIQLASNLTVLVEEITACILRVEEKDFESLPKSNIDIYSRPKVNRQVISYLRWKKNKEGYVILDKFIDVCFGRSIQKYGLKTYFYHYMGIPSRFEIAEKPTHAPILTTKLGTVSYYDIDLLISNKYAQKQFTGLNTTHVIRSKTVVINDKDHKFKHEEEIEMPPLGTDSKSLYETFDGHIYREYKTTSLISTNFPILYFDKCDTKVAEKIFNNSYHLINSRLDAIENSYYEVVKNSIIKVLEHNYKLITEEIGVKMKLKAALKSALPKCFKYINHTDKKESKLCALVKYNKFSQNIEQRYIREYIRNKFKGDSVSFISDLSREVFKYKDIFDDLNPNYVEALIL